MKHIATFFFLFACYSTQLLAQDTLPNFSAITIGKNKHQISWVNPYITCIQLAVQRSLDSSNYFTTIYSSQYPNLPQNGIIDNKAPQNTKVYYRIFYVLKGGDYRFTAAKTPTTPAVNPSPTYRQDPTEVNNNPPANYNNQKTEVKKFICVYKKKIGDTLALLEYGSYRFFADSIMSQTKDTLQVINAHEAIVKPFVLKIIWKPSLYCFTTKTGVVALHFPLAMQRKYKVVFTEPDGSHLFTINHVPDTDLLLEKSNFLHAGWFHFEIYENDKLLEKSKLYIDKKF